MAVLMGHTYLRVRRCGGAAWLPLAAAVLACAVSAIADARDAPASIAAAQETGGFSGAQHDAMVVTVAINPGPTPNVIQPGSAELVSVVAFSSGAFDATTIDPISVLFGANGTEATPLNFNTVDVDGDGRLDAMFQFEMEDTGLVCTSVSASLTAKTFAGRDIRGSQSVKTRGCKGQEALRLPP